MLQEDVVTLSTEKLNWVLDGYDVWTQPRQMLRFQHAIRSIGSSALCVTPVDWQENRWLMTGSFPV